jgi:hypothetical protein
MTKKLDFDSKNERYFKIRTGIKILKYSSAIPVLISIWNQPLGPIPILILIIMKVRTRGWFAPSFRTFIYQAGSSSNWFQN